MTHFKLAWRNIWRNKRRTLITVASIFFAVILSSFMMSIKEGMYDLLIDSSVGSFSGYVQVNSPEYTEDMNLDNGFEYTKAISEGLGSAEYLEGFIPRVESFALAASDDKTRGSLVVGTDVEREKAITGLDERVSEGAYLEPGENAVLVGAGLAEYLGFTAGDTIVLIGQGYHGTSAAGKFPIKGIIKFGSPELSKQVVLMPLAVAQQFYSCEGVVTQINIWPEDDDANEHVLAGIASVAPGLEIRKWQQVLPEIDKMISADRAEGYVFMFILYLVISFGIFGTILMMLVERSYEFGMLISIGMKRLGLGFMVWFEAFTLSLLGAIAGVLGAIPVCYYFNVNPITFGDEFSKMFEEYGMEPVMKASLDVNIYLEQALVVGILASLLSLYPLVKIMRLKPLDAMRS